MAHAAEERGLAFLTITDHSSSAHYAGGLDDGRPARAVARDRRGPGPRRRCALLRGTESDILADGSLDFPPEILGELDVVIASVHNRHKLDEDGMTDRLVTAMRQPVFKIWGHALGRLRLRREPIACRFDEILDAIAESARPRSRSTATPTASISIRSAPARPRPAASSSWCPPTPTPRASSTTSSTPSPWRAAPASAPPTC